MGVCRCAKVHVSSEGCVSTSWCEEVCMFRV